MNDRKYVSNEVFITEYELLHSTPERVYDFFRLQVEKKEKIQTGNFKVDKETEFKLLNRNEALITIALARYCLYPETLARVFLKARNENDLAIKLACITNVGLARYVQIPLALFDCDEASLTEWLKEASDEEIEAIFANQTIDDDFLTTFLEGEKYWEVLNEHKRLLAISYLTENKRMTARLYGTYEWRC